MRARGGECGCEDAREECEGAMRLSAERRRRRHSHHEGMRLGLGRGPAR